MSKKISISIPNKVKPNLKKLFHEFLLRKSVSPTYNTYEWNGYDDEEDYWNKVFPGWDDYLDDDSDTVYPINSKKNKRKHKNKNKARVIDINVPYSGDEDNPTEVGDVTEDYDDGYKEIFFYLDYHEKHERLKFDSIKSFNDYCESMGYYVSQEVMDELVYRYESHCCLCPVSLKLGIYTIMCEGSYAYLYYEACDEDELGD